MDHDDALIPPAPPAPGLGTGLPPVGWRWWEAVAVFGIALFVGLALAIPGLLLVASSNGSLRQLVGESGAEVGLGATVLGWLWMLHRRSVRALGLPSDVAREVGAGVLGGVGLYAVGVFGVGLIVSIVLHEVSHRKIRAPHQLPTHLSAPELALAGFTVIVLAPIAEELFFRGMLFRSLRSRNSFVFAGVVSAIFFGAAHYPGGALQNALVLPIVMCFVGFGLAWLYERRGNIVANMVAHATFNAIGLLLIALVGSR